jgi:hypothetical protein
MSRSNAWVVSPNHHCRIQAARSTRSRSMICSGVALSQPTAAAKCVFESKRAVICINFAQVVTRQSAKKFYVIDKIVPLNTSDGAQLQLILSSARAAYQYCMVHPPKPSSTSPPAPPNACVRYAPTLTRLQAHLSP